MRLEDEIKQKKFKSEYHKLIVNIIYSNNWLLGNHAQYLKPYGISLQQFNILRILRGQYPKAATVNLLIDRMLDKMSNASRLVEKLRMKGLIERKINESDRRAVDVLITQKGLDLLDELSQMDDKLEVMSVLTESEARELNNLLDKMRDKGSPRLPVLPM
jgi:DNA-binding MarR family transcriptional regulator